MSIIVTVGNITTTRIDGVYDCDIVYRPSRAERPVKIPFTYDPSDGSDMTRLVTKWLKDKGVQPRAVAVPPVVRTKGA